MARRSNVSDFLTNFGGGLRLVGEVQGLLDQKNMRAGIQDAMNAQPNTVAGYSPDQKATIANAILDSNDTGVSHDASGVYTLPTGDGTPKALDPQAWQYQLFGQTQATPFTDAQAQAARDNQIANVMAQYGDPAKAMDYRAKGLSLATAQREDARKQAQEVQDDAKQKNLDSLRTDAGQALTAFSKGDASGMANFFNRTLGATALGSDPSIPGGIGYDAKTNEVVGSIPDGQGGIAQVRIPALQALSGLLAATAKTDTGNVVDGANSLFTSFQDQYRKGLDAANTKSQIAYRAGALAAENHRTDVAAQGQGLNLVGRAYTANARSQPKPAKELTEKDVIAQNDGLGVRLDSIKNGIDPDTGKSIPQGQVSSRYTAEVQAGRDNIQLRGDAAGLRNAVTSGALSPEAAVAGMKARGASDARIAQVFQAAGVPLPGTEAPAAAPKTALPVPAARVQKPAPVSGAAPAAVPSAPLAAIPDGPLISRLPAFARGLPQGSLLHQWFGQ